MNVSPNDLLVWLGPAISRKHFEVGFDVKNSFCEKHIESEKAFHLISDQKWLADITRLPKLDSMDVVSTKFMGAVCRMITALC